MNNLNPLPAQASIIIVGAGIQGLSLAFNLAELGVRDIVVLDAGYWQGGASGRNGTLIRGAFSSPEWTRFFAHSCSLWQGLSKRLGENVMYSRRGYTMIGERSSTAALLDRTLDVHRACGINSSLLSAAQLRDVLPALAHERVSAALHLPDSGVAPHHAAMYAYRQACVARGVSIHYRTEVSAIDRSAGRVSGVRVGDQRLRTDTLVLAGGAESNRLAQLAGVPLDGYPMRLEAMALEPMRPLIGPAVALLDRLCYMHQTARGEVVGGAEVAERPQNTLNADVPVMAATAKAYLQMFPQLGHARILRQWAGLVHISKDFGPLLGAHHDLPGLFVSAGWCYGHAGAPAAGELLAKAIVSGQVDERMRPFAVDRFTRNQPVVEPGIVLSHFE
ncbi:NAD(P)/FAD-dependent oxidoreductase [Pseudomonas sp. CCC3.1]|uniref:NAD(P)/FAD-dependent oxidoreductase n=1 Tax=Pseudomonas sp. CCC3.1 TaxID=3048607 RepID=UPI002AC9C512|nr:FAD-dependent oxidoreductase [Pseudomonas sp. CCC3.1]MEB0204573.1 FAD-dependent oxidoreductase [Pseudomonas sp. CCC3.1]WPX38788.1 FAD-dependent oxidoreductase [Pseudomonas sp. CCC3.1]